MRSAESRSVCGAVGAEETLIHFAVDPFFGDGFAFSCCLGEWFSSQWIPINADGTVTIAPNGMNGGSTAWVSFEVRGYSM
jgi:hypothetical protein